jgi:hypothetical protein
MKTLIFVFLLLLSTNSFAQLQMPVSTGAGIAVDNGFNINYFQSSVTVDAMYKIDKLSIGSESITLISDSSTQFQTGVKFGFETWKSEDETKSLDVTTHALADLSGGKPIGVGVQYRTDNVQLSIDYSYVFSATPQNMLMFNVGYLFLK